MLKFNLQRVSFSGEIKVDCTLTYVNLELDKIDLTYYDLEFGTLIFTAEDLFVALEMTRRYLESKGYLLLCAGSMPNTYPSRMSRQMSNGRKAYVHTLGVKPNQHNIIDIFKPVGREEVGTLKDQKEFMDKWNNYFRNKELDQEITEEVINEAKNNPNGWVYKIDSNYDLSGDIPPEAIVGAWKVDENGNIFGEFIPNENYISLK